MKELRSLGAIPPAPFRIAGAACGGALLLASVLPNNGVLVLAGVCLLLFCLSWLLPPHRVRRTVTAGLCFAALALGLFGARMLVLWMPLDAFDGADVIVQGQVESVHDAEDGAYVIRVTQCDRGIPADTNMMVWLMENDVSLSLYDEVTLPVRVGKLKTYTRSWAGDGIFLTGTATDWVQKKAPDALPWYAVFSQTRTALVDTVRRVLPGEDGALIAAVCLGDRSALSDKTETDFRRAGLTHLMCVSGLHVSAVASALLFALRFLDKRLRAVIVCVAVWGFVAVVGFPVSAIRAGVLCTVMLVGQCLRVRTDGLSSLGLAFVLLVAINPFCIYDVGLLLSFGACLGLLTVTPLLKESLPGAECTARPVKWVRDSLCVTLGASMPVSPVLALTFGAVYPLSPLSNLVAVFPASVMLMLGCGAMLMAQVSFLALPGEWLLQAAGWISKGVLWFVDLMGRIPFASVPLNTAWAVVWVIGASMLVTVGLCLYKWKGLRIATACAALAFALGLAGHTAFMYGVCRLIVTDGSDTAAVVMTYRGRTAVVLCDAKGESVSAVQRQLQMMGKERADVLIDMQTADKTVAGFPTAVRLDVDTLGGESAELWEDMVLSVPAKGWLEIVWGETRVLFACGNADVQRLSDRDTDVMVFGGLPPKGAVEMTAGLAVAGCSRTTGAYMGRQLSAWAFPCEVTGGNGAVTVYVRSGGAVTVKR